MEAYNVEKVVKFIEKNCPDVDNECLDTIRKAKITGKRASKYTLDDWRNMGIGYGDVLDITSAIKDFSKGILVFEDEEMSHLGKVPPSNSKDGSNDSTESCSSTAVTDPAQPSTSRGITSSPKGFEKEFSGESNGERSQSGDEIHDDRFDCLAPYFSKKELEEMGDYEKESYIQTKVHYEDALSKGIHLLAPQFMRRSRTPATTEGLSHASGSGNQRKKTTTKKKSHKVRLTDEEVAASLPKFDVVDILSKSKQRGVKALRIKLEQDGIVYDKERKLMMRVLTNWLFYEHVSEIRMVTMDMKEGMAVSIVKKYPKFEDPHPTKRPWRRILDRDVPAGYIANCSISISRNADPKDRPRGGGQKKRRREDGESEQEDEESNSDEEPINSETRYHDKDAGWLSLTMPYAANKSSLVKGMQDSFPVRSKWVKEVHPTITDVLQKYPHLMSYGGEMLVQEFGLLYPGKSNIFAQNFPVLIQKVVDTHDPLPEVEAVIPSDESDLIKACMFIEKSLPRPNLTRYRRSKRSGNVESVSPLIETLIHIIPLGCNVETVVREKRQNARAAVQPYLMGMVPDKKITKLFIVADSKFIELEQNSLIFGLDMLFKTYHIFDVQYPLGWKNLWDLVEHGIVQIDQHKLSCSANEFLMRHDLNIENSL